MDATLLVGTAGGGLLASADGAAWAPVDGVPADARVFSLAALDDRVLAGGAGCVHRRLAGRWQTLPLPDPALEVWSLGVDAGDPSSLLAGCRPLALLRSRSGGETWERVPFELPPGTERPHTPRITAIRVNGSRVWCGVEVGGTFSSGDGGRTWDTVNAGLPSLDVHALLPLADGALLAATPLGVARHDGAWEAAALEGPWRYCRALTAASGAAVLCGLGDGPPGRRGGVARSADAGRTWRMARFPAPAGSTVWSLVAGGEGLALAGAIGGEVFVSRDGGEGWERTARGLPEIRAVLVA